MTQIASNVLVPGAYVGISSEKAIEGLAGNPLRTVFIGQKTAAGTASAETLVPIYSAGDASTKAGVGSMLHEMLTRWFENNAIDEVYMIALADAAASTAGTQEATVTGAATAAGTLHMYINGKHYPVGVASGDAVADVASAIAAKVTEYTDLPVSAASALGVATLTAKNKGTIGNSIDVRFNFNEGEEFPAGISVAVATGVTGATDPDMDDAIAAIPDTTVYGAFVSPYNDVTNTGKLVAEVERRYGPTVQTEGHVWQAMKDTVSNLIAFSDDQNSANQSVFDAGENTPVPAYLTLAGLVGQTSNALNLDPARPLKTLQINGSIGDTPSDQRIFSERQSLLVNGASINSVDANLDFRIGRIVTTYLTNAGGSPDTSYQSINTPHTASAMRQSIIRRVAEKFPRHKLAEDGNRFGAGQPIVTPKSFKAEMVALFGLWEEAGWAEDAASFIEGMTAVIDGTNKNKLNVTMSPNFVNQFHIQDITLAFIL